MNKYAEMLLYSRFLNLHVSTVILILLWFTQKGQQLLTELITNMNSRGYSKLSINENGDVTVRENGRNVRKDHFHEIPPKESWARLRELMMDEDVQVQVSGRQLTFAW